MKSLELKVYNILKKRPFIKNIVKYSYQGAISLFVKKKNIAVSKIITRENAFFGFHDKSPWSPCGSMLLGHAFLGKGNESLSGKKSVQVVVYTGEKWLEKLDIASTQAWNWQQGSQLHWLDNEHVLFNDFQRGRPVTRIVDIHGVEEKTLPYAVGAVHPGTRMFASFCYESFGTAMPGYGYDFAGNSAKSNIKPMQLIVGSIENPLGAISIDCTSLGSHDWSKDEDGVYCISHTQFSSTGRCLAFMKRLSQKGARLKTEMFLLDTGTREVKQFPFHDMVSHYCFIGDNKVLAYANTRQDGDGFYLVYLSSMKCKNVTDLLNNRDGHPSCSENELVAFDTYPDGRRHQELYLWKDQARQAEKIATLYAPLSFREESRVDLHPRISPDGKHLCFDTSFSGVRSLSTMELPDDS